METKKDVKLRVFDNYISFIKNSVGVRMFRNLYADVDGEKTDVTKDGDLSCAYFVSSVLLIFSAIDGVHATVDSTVKDMQRLGWVDTEDPKPGDVVVWSEKKDGDEEKHKHIGFVLGNESAISNSYKEKCPTQHPLILENRDVERFLSLDSLRSA